MITVTFVYKLAGLMFAAFAVLAWRDGGNTHRIANGSFWGLLALSFLAGDHLGDLGNGVLVAALITVGLMRLGRSTAATTSPEARRGEADRHGNRLFVAALIVPSVALAGTFLFKAVPTLADPKQATLVALALGVLIALAVCLAWLREPPQVALQEGRRLMDSVGWAAALPLLLTALGVLFGQAGVGEQIGRLLTAVLPQGSLIAAVIAYALGMALFTILMGNAFAAFPVMLSAVGLPLLIHYYHGNPAAVAALGMLAGFCGTLLTPMAANFNLVPAALLELPGRYGVIRAQAPTALILFPIIVALMYGLAFP